VDAATGDEPGRIPMRAAYETDETDETDER
jgi:hypothetical protein